MAKHSFLRGAVVLAVANTISRILGLVYMIALPRIIRDAGMGLLQMVKPIYYLGVVLAVAGLPVAVSKLVAEKDARGDTAGALRIFRVALGILLVTGVLCTVLLIWGAPLVARGIVQDPGANLALRAIAPSVVFLAIAAAWRGLFQGLQNMTPPAVSQIVEQVIRVAAMVILATLLMPRGVEYGAAGAAFGSVLGAAAGCLILVLYYVKERGQLVESGRKSRGFRRESFGQIVRSLMALSLPIVLGAILWPAMQMLDTVIVPARLQAAGFSAQEVRDLYGYYGMGLSLMYFPNILTWALAVSLVPAVSEAVALKTKRLIKYRSGEAIRITILFGLPAGLGLFLLADEISLLLFGYSQVGRPLSVLAFGSLFVGLYQTGSGILHGLGKVQIPVRNLLIGVAAKLVLNYVLTARPEFGVLGAAWGTTVGFTIAAILNLVVISRGIGLNLGVRFLLKAALATAIMGIAVPAVYEIACGLSYRMLTSDLSASYALANGIGVMAAVIAGALVYGTLVICIGAVTRKQIEIIPRLGPRLARWLTARGLLHE